MPDAADFIQLTAKQPDADLACDFAVAKGVAEFREQLAAGIVPPIRELPDGIEVTFVHKSWDAVLRYVDVESRCCPFLNLSARRTNDAVLVTVTGRPEAREFITAIFTSS